MLSRHKSRCALIFVTFFSLAQIALAAPPEKFVVSYVLHEDASSVSSKALIRVRIALVRQAVNEKSIGWKIASVVFRKFNDDGAPDDVWVADEQSIDTPDGLWWTTHDDVDHPASADFRDVPTLAGEAPSESPNGEKLTYSFTVTAPSPSNVLPWPVSATVNQSLALAAAPVIPPGTATPGELPYSGAN